MKVRAVATSVGARTPLGLSATPTAYVYRTAHIVMQSSPILDANEEPATMAVVPTLEPTLTGAERAAELALPALIEALAPLKVLDLGSERLKLVLCLDEPMRGSDRYGPAADLASRLTKEVGKLGAEVDLSVAARGPASLGSSLGKVLDELESGATTVAVVGGAHTDYDPERIVDLSRNGRLFTPDSLDALIPGESAAFAVLMRPVTARRYGLPARVAIHSVAAGQAHARPDNDASAFEASGLTAATRQAARPMIDAGRRCGWLLTDLSFETVRLYELQAMCTRTQRLWCEPQYCDAPAQRIGYLGGAAMPLHLVLAAEAYRGGFAPHDVAMSIAGSDAGERAVMLMSAPNDTNEPD